MELKSEYFDCDVDFMYCRCCFQLFTDSSDRFDFTFDFLSSLRDLFQFQLNFDGFDCSRWICKMCHDIVTNFRKFKIETLEKQAQFCMLIAKNKHKDLENIKNLTTTAVQLNLNFEDEKFKDEKMIKLEPLENFPEICVFDMPLTTESPLQTKKRNAKKENPKRSNRPTYEKNKRPVCCKICGKTYVNITRHRIKKHGLKFEFKCNKDKNCKFTCFEYIEFRNHRKTHDPPRMKKARRVCPYCAAIVSSLNFHIKSVHFKERNYFCDLCSYASYNKSTLQTHMESTHFEKNKVCEECGWKTNMEIKLKRHINYRHKNIKPEKTFLCTYPECGRACETKHILRDHIRRIHLKILNFVCEYPDCGKKHYSKTQLNTHMQHAHSKSRDFVCDTCGKSYASAAMLKMHNKAKHEEYKHACSSCNRSFKEKNILEKHIKRFHTQIKDQICDQCGKAFFDKRYLEHHIAVYHNGIRYECQVPGCKSSLSRRDVYITHLKSHALSKTEYEEIMRKCKEFQQKNNLVM